MKQNLFYWIYFIFKEQYRAFLRGALVTLEIAIIGTLLGYIFGFLLGLVQATPIQKGDSLAKKIIFGILKPIVKAFVAVFRGTPMMVQAMVIYYGLTSAGVKIPPFVASLLVLMLNCGAYMCETVRGGIISIDVGQIEGGLAMGMSYTKTMFSVVLPQAFRNIVPEMINQFLTNLKMTSVLNVINMSELFLSTKVAAGVYYRYFESYIICAIIYFIICTFFTKILNSVEKKVFTQKDYELAVEYLNPEEDEQEIAK